MRARIFSSLNILHPFFKRLHSNRLRVLAYHTVPDKVKFEQQVAYLHKEYCIIGIEDLLDAVEEKKDLPNNSLLITFDDGDITVYENALPVLKKYNLRSCLFIITSLINTSREVWIKRIEAREMGAGKTYLEAREVVKHLKQVDNRKRLKEMEDCPEVLKEQLTDQQLHEMENEGMFIGNHTHTHPMLDRCTPGEVQEELDAAREVFQKFDLRGFQVFAYPNGNEDRSTRKVLEKNGIKLVFLFDHKINQPQLDPMNVSRIKVDTDTEINEFKAKVSGVHPFLFNLR